MPDGMDGTRREALREALRRRECERGGGGPGAGGFGGGGRKSRPQRAVGCRADTSQRPPNCITIRPDAYPHLPDTMKH